MNQLSKYSRFLASYIDFAIFMNLINVANVLSGFAEAGGKEVKLLISIVLYSIIGIFYFFKDSVFKNASIGKYLVGLKLESTSTKSNPNRNANLFLRNVFSCIALALYMFFNLVSSRPLDGYIILLTFVVFNLIFFCFKPNKKLGDCLVNLQVVEDADNKLWKNIDTDEKNGCVAVVIFLLSLPLISFFVQIVLSMIRISWHDQYILMFLKGSLIIGLNVLVFYLYNKFIAKYADNVLLKRLMIVCAVVSVICSLCYSMNEFVIRDLRHLF